MFELHHRGVAVSDKGPRTPEARLGRVVGREERSAKWFVCGWSESWVRVVLNAGEARGITGGARDRLWHANGFVRHTCGAPSPPGENSMKPAFDPSWRE